jgi:hypothetical protein
MKPATVPAIVLVVVALAQSWSIAPKVATLTSALEAIKSDSDDTTSLVEGFSSA